MHNFSCIILAAGDSKNFVMPGNEQCPKTLADLNGKAVIRHVVDNAIAAGIPAHCITVVVKQALQERFHEIFHGTNVRLAFQNEARGSAHAVRLVMEQNQLAPCKHILLLMGDQPNFRPTSIRQIMVIHERFKRLVTVSTFRGNRSHPAFRKCGVIGTDAEQHFAIVRPERWEADMEMHAGPYVFLRSWLHECITHIDWTQPGEIHVYLAVTAAAALGKGVLTFPIDDPWETLGVDTYEALEAIRRGDRNFLNL